MNIALALLKRYWFPVALFVALVVGALWLAESRYSDGFAAGKAEVQEKWDRRESELLAASLKASEDARAEESRRQREKDEVIANAKKEQAAARAGLADADATIKRLLQQVSTLTGKLVSGPRDSAAGAGSPGNRDAGDLLANLFAGSTAASRELAVAADDYRIAWLSCQRQYDSLRSGK